MKPDEIARLRELLGKATPGPWRVKTTGNIGNQIEAQSGRKTWERDDGWRSVAGFQYCGPSENYYEQAEVAAATGELIAAAVNALPALLALAEAVSKAPVGVTNWDASVLVVDFVDDSPADWKEGTRVRLVAVTDGEVGK
jgi:hypothetical protein